MLLARQCHSRYLDANPRINVSLLFLLQLSGKLIHKENIAMPINNISLKYLRAHNEVAFVYLDHKLVTLLFDSAFFKDAAILLQQSAIS